MTVNVHKLNNERKKTNGNKSALVALDETQNDIQIKMKFISVICEKNRGNWSVTKILKIGSLT